MKSNGLKNIIISSFVRIIIEHHVVILLSLIIICSSMGYKNNIQIFIIILYFIMIIFIIKFICSIVKQINLIKRLDISECNKIEKQLKKPILFSRWNYILTNEYLINIRRFEVIKYENIVLIYRKIGFNPNTRNYLERYLYVITNNGKRHKFLIDYPLFTGPFSVQDFSYILKTKNPDILVGKGSNNKMIIEKKYNIKI